MITRSLTAVLDQSLEVHAHFSLKVIPQLNKVHSILHELHQRLGLLSVQTLSDMQGFTFHIGQDCAQVTVAHINNGNPISCTGGQRGQVLSRDRGQVHIHQNHVLHRA